MKCAKSFEICLKGRRNCEKNAGRKEKEMPLVSKVGLFVHLQYRHRPKLLATTVAITKHFGRFCLRWYYSLLRHNKIDIFQIKFYEQHVTELQLFSCQPETLIPANSDSRRSISASSLKSVLDESIQRTL